MPILNRLFFCFLQLNSITLGRVVINILSCVELLFQDSCFRSGKRHKLRKMGRTSLTNPTFSYSKSAYRSIPCTVYIFEDFTGGTYLPACLPAYVQIVVHAPDKLDLQSVCISFTTIFVGKFQ